MLSKEMYKVLSCFPMKHGKGMKYEDIIQNCDLTKEEIDECLNETLFPNWNYIRASNGFKNGSVLYLTESGLAEIEKQNDNENNQKLSKRAYIISILAMIATIINAIAAVIVFFVKS